MGIFRSNRGIYLPARGVATTLSLVFAFIYSKDLGIVNRSYIAVVMTFSVLIIIFMTSGTTLTLRNLSRESKTTENVSSFFSLILIEGLLGLVLFVIALTTFSNYKESLPLPLIYISLIYFLFSALHLVFMEFLLAYNNFKYAAKYEILTVIMQILFYYISKLFSDLSIASRLLLSISSSYLVIVMMCYFAIRSDFHNFLRLGNPKKFLRQTKGNHSIGTVLGVVDRLDRIVIAWFLPVVLLGKYTVMSSFISFFRFIPDSLAKLMISSKSESWRSYLKNPKIIIIGIVISIAVMILTSQFVISKLLGPAWLLPWGVSLLFALQELARGAFQLSGNYKVSIGSSFQTHTAAIALFFYCGTFSHYCFLLVRNIWCAGRFSH